MDNYQPGDILLLRVPFSSGEDAKRRPALVLIDIGDDDLVVARITTHASRSTFDVEIKKWQQAGLKAPCIIRLHKLATLEKQLIDGKLGKLAAEDWRGVQQKIKELWDSISIEDTK